MSKPRLLLCFDAFGTLFRPKRSVAQQYGEVARKFGVVNFTDKELESHIVAAIKDESKKNPNYGKATGLNATQWWTNIIHKSFTPLVGKDQTLPPGLAPALLHRFSSSEGYETEPQVISALKSLKDRSSSTLFEQIVVGVITNSDDRVPSVLSSLGFHVSPLRYGTKTSPNMLADQSYDIEFHCMSYDVGVQKPDRQIFRSAELMLAQLIELRSSKSATEAEAEAGTWQKVYVGDEYAKDVVGARNAGWSAVLVAEESDGDIAKLQDNSEKLPDELFKEHPAIMVPSIPSFIAWLKR